jgi:hypothetical protein
VLVIIYVYRLVTLDQLGTLFGLPP